MDSSNVIAVDLGGTNLRVALIDSAGCIKKYTSKPTLISHKIEDSIAQIIDAIDEVKENSSIEAIGMAVAGQIDSKNSKVVFAPNLSWHDVPLKETIESVYKVPTFLINDVRAATIGEWMYGSGQNSSNIFCVFVGTGIGGGFIAEDKLIDGYNNSFGEIGHMVVDINGPICGCGNHGCIEAIASGSGITRIVKNNIYQSKNEALKLLEIVGGNVDIITAKSVVSAYNQGDLFSEKIIANVYRALTSLCISIVNVFNPEKLIIAVGIYSTRAG